MNVLIAEDHLLTAKLFASILSKEENFNIVGIAANGIEAVNAIKENIVDVLILDINMPFMDGFQVMESIKESSPNTKVLVLSAHTEAWIIKQSMRFSAAGYFVKNTNIDEIKNAVETVHAGKVYLDEYSNKLLLNDTFSQEPSVNMIN